MATLVCKCGGDPVGDSAALVLAAILSRKEKPKLQRELEKAQKTLITRIAAGNSNHIIWTQTYIEPEERLAASARRSPGDADTIEHMFLHHAAGISVSSEVARSFYDDVLIPRLNAKLRTRPENDRRKISLSFRFALPDVPPLVSLWWSVEEERVRSDWDTLDNNIDPLYGALFEDETRRGGEYVHIACPCRSTELGEFIGPAGSYVFLGTRGDLAKLPQCFVWHVQMFVQALVTAQLWAIAQHQQEVLAKRRDELQNATRQLRKNFGVLREVASEARELANMSDPLQLITDAFDEAQKKAQHLFATPPSKLQQDSLIAQNWTGDPTASLHTVGVWLKLPDDARAALSALVLDLRRIVVSAQRPASDKDSDPSSNVVSALADAIDGALSANDDEGLELSLRHAKALAHSSVIVRFLVAESTSTDTIRPLGTGGDDDLALLYLRQAAVHLWSSSRKTSGDEAGAMIKHLDPNKLGIRYGEGADRVYDQAVKILDRGEWGTSDRDGSATLANIIRGLRGGGDLDILELEKVEPDYAAAIRGSSGVDGDVVWVLFKEHRED